MNEMEFPEMAQDPTEFSWLLNRIKSLEDGPRGAVESILEIGVWQGGCLARFGYAFPWARVVGIDPNPMIGNWHPAWGNLNIVYGASQGHDDMHRALLANDARPFDVVVIDGDHTMPAAMSDWEWAKIHATKMIAIHDIASLRNPQIDCRELWAGILLQGYRTESIGYPTNDHYGIGVVFL